MFSNIHAFEVWLFNLMLSKLDEHLFKTRSCDLEFFKHLMLFFHQYQLFEEYTQLQVGTSLNLVSNFH